MEPQEVTEKQRRIYYQDIVYSVCNSLDRIFARRILRGGRGLWNESPNGGREVTRPNLNPEKGRSSRMEIQIKSTDTLTTLDGVPVRLWEGVTANGVECKVFVHRLAVKKDADTSQFEAELKEKMQPGAKIVPLRQIL